MSQVALFFHSDLPPGKGELELQQDTAKHMVQVLRMKQGDRVALTDGKGRRADAVIATVSKKQCVVTIESIAAYKQPAPALHMAVAFTKNTNRNEWLLEKITELGVSSIVPLSTSRSEREKFRFDRFNNILVAAMMQSRQYYLPELKELTPLEDVLEQMKNVPQKLVAHCMEDVERTPIIEAIKKDKETLLLIGPEGDFTEDEVNSLTSTGYTGISMGSNRLRTETAAVNACAVFNMINHG